MKSAIQLLFMVLILIGFSQCKSAKEVTAPTLSGNTAPFEYDGRLIIFGTGGGFAGKIQQWTLFDDGILMAGQTVENRANGQKVEQRVVDQMFHLYDEHGFGELQLNEPSNLYFFLKMKDKDGLHNLVWGDKKIPILSKYHHTLYQLAKSKTKVAKHRKKAVSR